MLPDTSPASSLVLLRSCRGLPCAKSLGLVEGKLAVVESYGRENRWRVEAHRVDTFARFAEVLDAAAGLSDAIVVRGTIDPATPYDPAEGVLRRLIGSPNGGGHWTATARTWIPVDFDGAEVPAGTVEAQVSYLVEALPEPFRGRSCWYQLTSSHGLDGDPTKVRARLWFLANGPVGDAALVAAMASLPAPLHVDVSIYRGVQPIYVARPTFRDGIADHVRDRTGVVEGFDGELVPAAELPAPSDAAARGAFTNYAKRIGASTAHPVELANVREHILKGNTKGSRHMHALGAACELLVIGADADEAADVIGEVIAKQGRPPNPGEVAGILAWAIAKHASGEVRAERAAMATLLPTSPPDAEPDAGGPGAPPVPPEDGGGGGGGDDDDADGGGFGAPVYSANANANAHQYLNAEHAPPKGAEGGAFRYTFVRLSDGDYEWTGTHYRRMGGDDPPELDARLQRVVGVAVVQTAAAIRRLARVNGTPAAPFWIDPRPGDPSPGSLVAFRNGVLNVDDLVFGAPVLRPHDPRLFTPGALPFDYDPAAKCPAFDAWVAGMFTDDDTREEYRKLLGYCLLPDNPDQRLVMLSGVPRSGKGLTQTLLQNLVGEGNWTASLLSELGSSFGLEDVLGKRLLTIGEMNDHRETAVTQCAVDRLKAMSGGDPVGLNRKGLGILTTRIGAKVVIACNRFPKLLDPSGALVDRLVVFRFEHGHAGREDRGLLPRLLGELPGIALRALEGLRVILTGEPLRTPPSAAEYVANEVRGSVSPLGDFIGDALVFRRGAPDESVELARVYNAYRAFAAEHGHDRPLTLGAFLGDLTSATPLRRTRPSAVVGVKRPYRLTGPGLALTPTGEAWATANGGGFA